MTTADDINRVFREYVRYTGDGLPFEPSSAPLPIGDPTSGAYSPKKAEIRDTLGSLSEELDDAVASAAAQAALATAGASAAAAVGGSAVPYYDTRTLAAAATIPAARAYIILAGYAAAGDHGAPALYKRVATQPSHNGAFRSIDRFLPNGSTDATNGGWWELVNTTVHPKMFGCAGDGSTNDATNWQSCLTYPTATVIDGGGLTYKINSTLTGRSNVTVQNCVFDLASIAQLGTLFSFAGTRGSGILLTANRSRESLSVALASATGIARGDWLLLRTTRQWEQNSGTVQGENLFVLGVSGLTVSMRQGLRDAYATADAATVYKVTPVERVYFKNCRFIGGGDGTYAGEDDQYAIKFSNARHCSVENCKFQWCDYSSVEFATCYDCHVRECFFGDAQDDSANTGNDGASYGVDIVSGSELCTVSNSTFSNFRHGIATGGTDGVNRNLAYVGNTMIGCRAGGIDVHPGSDDVVVSGNVIDNNVGAQLTEASASSGSQNGLQVQSGNCVISNNIVRGAYNHGIVVQVYKRDWKSKVVISGNNVEQISTETGNWFGIFVEANGGTSAGISGLTINGNTIDGGKGGIKVSAAAADIQYVGLSGNAVTTQSAAPAYDFSTTGAFVILYVGMSGNSGRSSGTATVSMAGASAAKIAYVSISGNAFFGGSSNCIVGTNVDRVTVVGNVAVPSAGTAISLTGTNVSNVANNQTT